MHLAHYTYGPPKRLPTRPLRGDDEHAMKFSSQRVLIAAIAFGLATFIGYRMVRPMNIFVVTEEFERPMDVVVPPGLRSLSARECGTCHREAYQEWSESMHAHAWVDPYFQVDFEFDRSQQICLNCHTPLRDQQENLVLGFRDREKFQPILFTNESFDAALRDQGVTCAVCHVRDGVIIGCLLINGVNGNRNPHICGNRKLHTSGEDVSGGAGHSPGNARRAFWAGRRERSDRSPGQHAPRSCGAGGHGATPSRCSSDAVLSQC